jgi:hypothetical protein
VNGADGISDIEGKAARVAASELGSERVSMALKGSATRLRQGYGVPSIEGKAARVASSESGDERVSNSCLKIFQNFASQFPNIEVRTRNGRERA